MCSTSRGQLADGRQVFVKRCPYPADAEADGLHALAAAGIPAPAVLGVAGRTLVLEYVSGQPAWAELGQAVARMHRTVGPRYGWHRDNRAGRFVQPNGWLDNWPTFYASRRIRPHLDDPAVPPPLRQRLEKAAAGPLLAVLPDHPTPSLTHGDLWIGNVVDGRWLVDPEVCFADRELDLAYMETSGHFPAEFWTSYYAQFPVDPTYADRRPALQLHHLLLQVRHFGDRCLAGVEAALAAYGW